MADNSVKNEPVNPTPLLPSMFYMVPCIPDFSSGTFEPLFTLETLPWSMQSKTAPKKPESCPKKWSGEEEERFKSLVSEIGTGRWSYIASVLNHEFHEDTDCRKGRICRERWVNYTNPSLNKGDWTAEEDLKLMTEQRTLGKKWSKIAKQLTGRTENSVKNRFYSLINKTKKFIKMESNCEDDVREIIIRELKANKSSDIELST